MKWYHSGLQNRFSRFESVHPCKYFLHNSFLTSLLYVCEDQSMEQVIKETEEVTSVERTAPEQVVRKTTTVTPPPVGAEHPQQVYAKKKVIFRTYQIIWYILGVIEVILGFRMALKALGANPMSGFVSFIYTVSDPFALPFQGIFVTSVSGASIVEWSTLIAAFVYALIAYGLVYLMQLMKPVTPTEVESSVDSA